MVTVESEPRSSWVPDQLQVPSSFCVTVPADAVSRTALVHVPVLAAVSPGAAVTLSWSTVTPRPVVNDTVNETVAVSPSALVALMTTGAEPTSSWVPDQLHVPSAFRVTVPAEADSAVALAQVPVLVAAWP